MCLSRPQAGPSGQSRRQSSKVGGQVCRWGDGGGVQKVRREYEERIRRAVEAAPETYKKIKMSFFFLFKARCAKVDEARRNWDKPKMSFTVASSSSFSVENAVHSS